MTWVVEQVNPTFPIVFQNQQCKRFITNCGDILIQLCTCNYILPECFSTTNLLVYLTKPATLNVFDAKSFPTLEAFLSVDEIEDIL